MVSSEFHKAAGGLVGAIALATWLFLRPGMIEVGSGVQALAFIAVQTIERDDGAQGRPRGLLQHTERKTAMHTLTFNDDERTLLIEMLDTFLAKLPHEIHQTGNRAYRDMLEEKQGTLQQLLKRLEENPVR